MNLLKRQIKDILKEASGGYLKIYDIS